MHIHSIKVNLKYIVIECFCVLSVAHLRAEAVSLEEKMHISDCWNPHIWNYSWLYEDGACFCEYYRLLTQWQSDLIDSLLFCCCCFCWQHTNLFWPQWKPGHHRIEKKILMPELVSRVCFYSYTSSNCSQVPRPQAPLPDLFDVCFSMCNIGKLGIGPGNEAMAAVCMLLWWHVSFNV